MTPPSAERLKQGVVQTLITWLCNNHHNRVSLRDLVKSAPIAGQKWYWFHKDDTYGRTDIVDKTKIIELYGKTPTPANSCMTHPCDPRAPSSPITNTNKPMYGKLHENRTPLPGLMETTRTSKATQQKQKRTETPKKKPYYS